MDHQLPKLSASMKEIVGKVYERHPNLITYSEQDEGNPVFGNKKECDCH